MLDTILKITWLALIDAVNPCTLTVQALLLSALLITKGKKEVLAGGFLFAATIFVMYFLYGVGILKLIYISGIRNVISVILLTLLLIMAATQIYAFFSYRPGFTSMEMPMFLRPYVKKAMSGVENTLIVIPVAVFCSILLLPCSSGPYIVALGTLALHDIFDFLLLLYYNVIFVSPMILITLVVACGVSPEKVVEWKERHIRELHLISGILLLAVFFMMIGSKDETTVTGGDSFIYLIYSESCPHCHHLIDYLKTIETNVAIVKTKDPSIAKVLLDYNYNWHGGVPLLFGITGSKAIVVLGFPSENQDKNGYLMGKEYEQNLCIESGGKAVEQDGTYKYCILPDGSLLGNYNSVRHLIKICEENRCKEIQRVPR